MADISARGRIPLLVGGTMLYFKALEQGMSGLPEADAQVRMSLDAEAATIGWPAMHAKLAGVDALTAARLAPNDSQRIQRALEVHAISGRRLSDLIAEQSSQALPYQVLKIALLPSDRQQLHERIALRFEQMLGAGLVDEVRALLIKYPVLTAESTAMRCVGYRQVLHYLAGEISLEELRDRGIFATRQLAKRQLTWLRGMPQVRALDCLQSDINELVFNEVNQFIKGNS
jgi:tRNA dimethylallyltransferase